MVLTNGTIKVALKQGTLIGYRNQLQNDSFYYSFKGIPYAKPPIGNLRFKAPQILEKFPTNEIDCAKEGNSSFQKNLLTNQYEGAEDCLYLNVYTPNLAKILNKNALLPVLVWIHGGSFQMGSGDSNVYGPEHFLEENVVLVTINYRLGILGFLSFPEGNIAGNAGLKDQRMAFKWISENIEQFNGNPDNVTLFGESAGGASVHYHYLSDKSRKYFHKAIIQSGTANMNWALQQNPTQKAKRLADLLGINKPATDKEIAEFLINYKNLDEMYKHFYHVLTPAEKQRDIVMPFRPSIELSDSVDAVIVEPFSKSIKNQNYKYIPIIFGCTSSEGIVNLQGEMMHLKKYNEPNYPRWIPYRFPIDESNKKYLKLINDIKTFYMKNTEVKNDNLNPFVNYLSDANFIYEFYKTIEQHITYQPKNKIYAYKFSFVGELNLYKNLLGYKHLDGAGHADELFYLFKQTFLTDYDLKPDTREHRILKVMCRMWSDFARYGNPTPQQNNLIDFKWTEVRKNVNKEFVLHFLELNDRIEMQNNFWNERIKFWGNIEENFDGTKKKLLKL